MEFVVADGKTTKKGTFDDKIVRNETDVVVVEVDGLEFSFVSFDFFVFDKGFWELAKVEVGKGEFSHVSLFEGANSFGNIFFFNSIGI